MLRDAPDAVIVDHANEIISGDEKKPLDDYILHFRQMAIEKNFAAILCAQCNRQSQEDGNKRARLHHLKGSGKLEESCDIGIIIHYPHKQDEKKSINDLEIYIDKNRNGRTGRIEVCYDPQYYLIRDWTDLEMQRREEEKEIKVKPRKNWGQ